MQHSLLRILLPGLISLALSTARAQQQPSNPPEQPAGSGAAAHYDRMAAAKAIFLKNLGGDDIPFNVISRNFESWGRYILVDSADKADLIIEIQSPDNGSGDKDKDSERSKTNVYGGSSQRKEEPKPSIDTITFTVYDKNKRPLWIAREEPKSAMKRKTEESHLVEAAQKIFTRFHDRIEPPVKH